MSSNHLRIDENRHNGTLTLCLSGELDLASAPTLAHRLAELRTGNLQVRLDLSKLQFIDSSGIHVLVQAFRDAQELGCQVEMEPGLSPQVRRVFSLVRIDRLTGGQVTSGG